MGTHSKLTVGFQSHKLLSHSCDRLSSRPSSNDQPVVLRSANAGLGLLGSIEVLSGRIQLDKV